MARAKKRAKTTTRAKAGKNTRKKASKRSASRRELIAPRGDKRYVRRTKGGQFSESDDVSRSLSADRRREARTKAKRGQGDRGD